MFIKIRFSGQFRSNRLMIRRKPWSSSCKIFLYFLQSSTLVCQIVRSLYKSIVLRFDLPLVDSSRCFHMRSWSPIHFHIFNEVAQPSDLLVNIPNFRLISPISPSLPSFLFWVGGSLVDYCPIFLLAAGFSRDVDEICCCCYSMGWWWIVIRFHPPGAPG